MKARTRKPGPQKQANARAPISITISNTTPPDYRSYQGFRVGAQYAVPVARVMRNAMPRDATPEEESAMVQVEDVAQHVKVVYAERDRVSPSRTRARLGSFANAWSAIHEQLTAKGRLPEELGDIGPRALALNAAYFAEGVGFVKHDAYAAWFEGHRRIERLEGEGTMGELEALVGPEAIAYARKATDELGDAFGAGSTAIDVPSSTALADVLNKFSRAVGAYARLLMARVDEDDPASIERFRRAMQPIDDFRAMRDAKDAPSRDADAPVAPEPVDPGT